MLRPPLLALLSLVLALFGLLANLKKKERERDNLADGVLVTFKIT